MAVRIAVVGDVHGDWDARIDEKALQHLKPDLVLFTGDFGDEDVKMVKEVAKLNMPKAVILGNHDCCSSALGGRIDGLYDKLSSSYLENLAKQVIYFFTKPPKPAVPEQIEKLGDSFVGYKRVDYLHLQLSVVGARPFAMGGDGIYGKHLVSSLFGIANLQQSAEKIKELILDAPENHSVIVLGHNGPTGLGSEKNDICGKDFATDGGDGGDKDLEEALKFCEGKREVPLVVFGHMHKFVKRKMVVESGGKVYVNGAVVPRKEDSKREFTMVELRDGRVTKVTETWVTVQGWSKVCSVSSEVILFEYHTEN